MQLEWLIGTTSILVTILISITMLAYWLGKKFAQLELRLAQLERSLRALGSASAEAQRVLIDFLSLKGIIERSEAEYLGSRVRGLFQVYMGASDSGLTQQELEFLKQFFSSDLDKLSTDQAERAYQLGKKLFLEDWDERGFLAAIAAAYIRGYLVSKQIKQRAAEK